MSARLRNIARETQAIVEAGRYRAPDGHEVSIERALGSRSPVPGCTDPSRCPSPSWTPTAPRSSR
ncbi:hypothetical protein NKH18_46900 [Streptomyces sp. M10(2022)]